MLSHTRPPPTQNHLQVISNASPEGNVPLHRAAGGTGSAHLHRGVRGEGLQRPEQISPGGLAGTRRPLRAAVFTHRRPSRRLCLERRILPRRAAGARGELPVLVLNASLQKSWTVPYRY